MKRFICATLSLALLGTTGAVGAQPNNRNDTNQSDNRNARDRSDNDRNDNNRNDQGRNDRGPNRDRGDQHYGNPRWSRGDRLPDQYRQNRYVANDWQQRGYAPGCRKE